MKHLKHHIGFLWLQSVVVAMSLFSLPLFANDFYLNNMTSPQVSDMFRYGNVETSLFTGKLNIAIPIYTLNDPDFDLNIALRYNSEAFKPNKQSGYVGYNWFLEAGGCITREVKNLADEMDRKDATHQIPHQGMLVFTKRHNIDNVKIFNLDTTEVVIPCNNYNHYNLLTCDTTVDYLPDIFHFNFCNHQGSFIIDNDGEAIILNGDFVKVDLSRLVDCESNHNGQKLPVPNPSSQITLTTLDGYTYIFGGDLSSLGYTLNTVCDSETNIPIQDAPTVNTWYLRQIIAPNNRDILFHYKSHLKGFTNDSNYIDYRDPIWSFTEYRDQLIGAPYHGIKDYNQQLRQSITKECILDSIVVKGNQRLTIEFCNRIDSFKLYPYNMCMKNYMLDMIRIKNNESILQTAQLQSEYTHSTSAQGAPYNYWRFLSSVNISGIGKYIMSYDNSNTFPLIGISDDNYKDNISNFGYYTRSHTLGLLSSIIYPTGGTQTLTYTQHEWGTERRFSTDSDAHVRLLSDTSNLHLPLGRGVRIDEIKSYLDNTLIETKSYSYTRKNTSLSSGIYYNTLGVFNQNRPNAVEIIKNAFNYSLIESYIGYSTITETTTYHSTNDTQKVIYSFNTGISSYSSRNDLINRINQTHYSNDSIAAILSGMLVYDGNLIPNGQLLSIDYYKNNLPLRTKQYIYNGISNTTGVIQNSQYPSLGCTDTVVVFADHHIAIARKLFVYPSVLTEEITKDFLTNNQHVYNTRNILHDTKLRNKQEWITNSDGTAYFTKYTYPDELVSPTMSIKNNPYVHLCARNQLNVPLEQVSGYIKDGAEYVLSGKVNEYAVGGMIYMSNTPRGITPFDSIGPLLPTDQYPYLSRNLELQISGEINDYTPLSLNGTHLVYDSRYRSTCNYRFDHNLRLIEITPVNQITTTYTWDGIYPVSQTVGNQTSTYTYVPYVGISSSTDIRGMTTYYEYDMYGRLIEVYQLNNGEKEILNKYVYHTKTE